MNNATYWTVQVDHPALAGHVPGTRMRSDIVAGMRKIASGSIVPGSPV